MANKRSRRRGRQQAKARGHGQIVQIERGDYVRGNQYTYFSPGSGPAPEALAALPPAPAKLPGRDDKVDELLGLLDPAQHEAEAVVVSAVAGLAGVGKTALALYVGHQAVAERGWFPGGVFFLDLRGYDPDRQVAAEQALGALLRAMGVRDEDLPPTIEEQAGLYRSLLAGRASQQRPILLVLDNVSATDQVDPLLPGQREHRVLVTSRHTLASLPARLIDLAALNPPAASELIRQALATARPGDPRIRDEPEAVTHLAERCGFLPLALQIAAAILKADPGRSIADLADDLQDERTRLEKLRYEETGGRSLAVRAAFDLSYRRLTDEQAQLFRLLALAPGPDISTEAAAAAVGHRVQVRPLLVALSQAHLLDEQPVAAGRWGMHDLVRLYAAELASERRGQEREALDRLLGYYSEAADAADDQLRAPLETAGPERFRDLDDALAWLDEERLTLISATTLAAATGRANISLSLATSLTKYLRQRRHFDDLLLISQTALDAARAVSDPHVEGRAQINLGAALEEVLAFDDAVTAFEEALNIFRELGDRQCEGQALNGLGNAQQGKRKFGNAVNAYEQAEHIFREIGDRDAEAGIRDNIGCALQGKGEIDAAVIAHEQAAQIFRELGDRRSESLARAHVGQAMQELGRPKEAVTAHLKFLEVCREIGDRLGEGGALQNLGNALRGDRRFRKAIRAHRKAVEIFQEIGDPRHEARGLADLGLDLIEVHRFRKAIRAHRKAVEIFQEIGDRHAEGKTLGNLGATLWQAHRSKEAIRVHEQVVDIFRELDDHPLESKALSNLRVMQAASTPGPSRISEMWRNWMKK
ncbi:tetratricopeptide repeat protein [Streptomyces sp. FXJ1.4098]|nr:tetratricopeptide repeat protein [Streptomyces sp. FXJ1.4098]